MSGQPDLYAVAGNPVSHSLSPVIHAAFATQTGEAVQYGRLRLPPDGFARGARAFFAAGGSGLNVTVPFKADAARLADDPGERVRRAGAANTLWPRRGRLVAENTDGIGLTRDLRERHGIELAGRDLLLIGAGGAARGVIGPLCEAGVARILIANRTRATAEELAGVFSDLECAITACALGDLEAAFEAWRPGRPLVLNASSAALSGERLDLPSSIFDEALAAYDMMYGADPTPFLVAAAEAGCRTCFDGLGMLVEQAAESFACWRGVRPDTAPVYRELRRRIAPAAV